MNYQKYNRCGHGSPTRYGPLGSFFVCNLGMLWDTNTTFIGQLQNRPFLPNSTPRWHYCKLVADWNFTEVSLNAPSLLLC